MGIARTGRVFERPGEGSASRCRVQPARESHCVPEQGGGSDRLVERNRHQASERDDQLGPVSGRVLGSGCWHVGAQTYGSSPLGQQLIRWYPPTAPPWPTVPFPEFMG